MFFEFTSTARHDKSAACAKALCLFINRVVSHFQGGKVLCYARAPNSHKKYVNLNEVNTGAMTARDRECAGKSVFVFVCLCSKTLKTFWPFFGPPSYS